MKNKEVDFNNKGFNRFLNENCSDLRLNKSMQVLKIDREKNTYEIVSDGFIKILAIIKLDSDFGIERYEAYAYFRLKENESFNFYDEEKQFKIRFKLYISPEFKNVIKNLKGIENKELREIMEISIVNPGKYLDFIQALNLFNVYNRNAFINAVENYFIYTLLKAEEKTQIYTFSVGWKNINNKNFFPRNEFLGITMDSWDINFSKSMRLINKDEAEISIKANIERLEQYVFRSPVAMMIFMYNILAVSNPLISESMRLLYKNNEINYKGRIFPGICIFGENGGITKKSIANLLINWFEVNPKRLNSIRMSYNLHLDSAYHTQLSRGQSHDIPFLITSRNDLTGRDYLRARAIIYDNLIDFPVFISKLESPFKEIVDLDIKEMLGFPLDRESQLQVRESVDSVIVGYIYYLKLIFLNKNFPAKIAETISTKEIDLLNSDLYDDEEAHFALVFLSTIEVFNSFLIENGFGHITQRLYSLIEEYWNTKAKIYELKQNELGLIGQFTNYIESLFFNGIDGILHWEGKERNGAKEDCYYIEHKEFISSFRQFIKSNISEYEVYKALKKEGVIKVRSNQASIGQYRIHQGKKIYVLILLKDKIEKIKRNG